MWERMVATRSRCFILNSTMFKINHRFLYICVCGNWDQCKCCRHRVNRLTRVEAISTLLGACLLFISSPHLCTQLRPLLGNQIVFHFPQQHQIKRSKQTSHESFNRTLIVNSVVELVTRFLWLAKCYFLDGQQASNISYQRENLLVVPELNKN